MQKRIRTYNDIELVKAMRTGKKAESEAAFKELYNRYYGYVHAYCTKLLGSHDAAQDVFQETFIRFYQNAKYEGETNIKAYLLTIARNLCFNEKRISKPTVSYDEVSEIIPAGRGDEGDNRELQGIINNSIELLNEAYKEIFVLRQYSRLSYKEIGELMNTTEEGAKVKFFRAKKQLQKILKPYLNDFKELKTY